MAADRRCVDGRNEGLRVAVLDGVTGMEPRFRLIEGAVAGVVALRGILAAVEFPVVLER